MCVWLPNWPIQRLSIAQPQLKRQALILHTESGRRGPEVVAASRTAVDMGIAPGLPVAEARALAGISAMNGGVQFELHDPWADRASLKTLAHWCQQFTPIFGIDDADQPQSLLLDISGCVHLFGSEQQLGEQVVRSFAAKGYVVQVAIADTISAAWAVARFGNANAHPYETFEPPESSSLVGDSQQHQLRIHDERITRRVFVVEPKRSMATMDPFPIIALRISERSVTTLHRLGIETIRQLRSLPRQDLPSRFGDEIVTRIEQALGRRPESLTAERPAEPIEAEWTGDEAVVDQRAVTLILDQLVERISEKLRKRHEGARELLCRLDPETGKTAIRFSVGLLRPENECDHLQELVQMQLESSGRAQSPGRPQAIARIRIRAIATPLQVSRQRQLFSEFDETDRSAEFSLLMNRLSNRMGTDTVLRPRLVADVQPERAARFEPLIQRDGTLTEGVSKRSNEPQQSTTVMARPNRPTRLLPKPIAINVSVADEQVVPDAIVWRGCELSLGDCEGPERIDTGWWRDDRIRRDYYRWDADTGQRLWMFHCRQSGRWFVHGLFE